MLFGDNFAKETIHRITLDFIVVIAINCTSQYKGFSYQINTNSAISKLLNRFSVYNMYLTCKGALRYVFPFIVDKSFCQITCTLSVPVT